MIGGAGGLFTDGWLFTATQIVAADDPVVVAALDPIHQLAHAPDGQRVRDAQLEPAPVEPVERPARLLELGRLAEEGVQVELGGRGAAGHRHQGAAHSQRIARRQRGGAVAAELAGAEPFQEREPDRVHRQREQRPAERRDRQQDHERGLVEPVAGEDVTRLVSQYRAQTLVVEQRDDLGVDDDERPLRADGHRVRDRRRDHVELRQRIDVEHVEGLVVERPHARQLILA